MLNWLPETTNLWGVNEITRARERALAYLVYYGHKNRSHAVAYNWGN